MWSRITNPKLLLVIVSTIAMLGVLACGGADEEAAAAPAAAPVIDTAAIAAEVAKSVSAAAPKTASPAEIEKMVQGAVAAAAQPGVTAADMEAAVTKATAGQLSAAEVKSIVDASIKALPAPELDVAELRSLVQQSVKASVPKGTSAAEIQRMVEAAVAAASADVATRGDMEAAIAKSVKEAAAGQLTAAQVQKIVDASTAATVMAAEEAAVAAAMAAVPSSLGETFGGLAAINDPERTKQQYLAKVSRNGLVTGVYDGPAVTKFNEAPMLAKLVKEGKLPPVDKRLPDEPAVIPVHEAIGKYGGTWRRFYTHLSDHPLAWTSNMGDWDWNGLDKVAVGLKSYSLTNGGRTVTYNMRPGMKWSDGVEFTSEDFKWFYETIMKNKEYFPTLNNNFRDPITGAPMVMETPDKYTVIMDYENPNYGWVDASVMNTWGTQGPRCWAPYGPAHYLKQFHPETADKAKLDAMIKEVGGKSWVDVMAKKCNGYSSVEMPTTDPWMVIDGHEPPQWILQRNPYYWAVDPAGNQLPYIDNMLLTMIEDIEVGNLKAIAGEIDLQGRHMEAANLPLFLQYSDRGGYRVQLYPNANPTDWGFWINQSYDLDPVIGDLLRKRDFRRALGLAVDREKIKEVIYAGNGEIRSYAAAKGSLFDPGDEWRNWDIERDVALANKLLDGIGLTEKDADGFRLRSDGKGPLTLAFDTRPDPNSWFLPVEMMIEDFKDIGLKLTLKLDRKEYLINRANKGYFGKIYGGKAWNCWIGSIGCVPASTAGHLAVEVGSWYSTGGAKGEAPTIDKYKNEDGRYIMKELLDAWDEGKGVPMQSPERRKLAKFLYSTLNLESMAHAFVGSTATVKGLFIINQDMRNVPDPRTVITAGFYNQPPRPDIYYYENPEQHLHYVGQ